LKIACVAVVKNEARHIAEWLAWQFHTGFDTVFLFDNGSTDGTQAIARHLGKTFDVRVQDWPVHTEKYQIWAYEVAARKDGPDFDWMAFFDTDEFLVLDPGLSLKQLLAARPEPAVIIPWALFGSSGHEQTPDGLVIEAFTRRAPAEFDPNRHFKSIIRPGRCRACITPHHFDCGAPYVDLFGTAMPDLGNGCLAAMPVYRGAKLHHYFTRARADWAAKMQRGYPGFKRQESDFALYDRNEMADHSAAAQAPAIRALLAQAAPRHRFAICACARWENRYIVEWLNYYRAIGFDHVYLYCNDDDPAELYERVLPFTQGPAPFVTFRFHPIQGEQAEIYIHFLRHYAHDADWIGFFDIDEFLRLPPGESIGQFIGRFPADIDCMLFNWVFFGPNGHKEPPAGNVLENFTTREASIHPYTKFVVRPGVLRGQKLFSRATNTGFWHWPMGFVDQPFKAVNPLGEDVRDYNQWFEAEARRFVNEPARRDQLLETAMVHHYAFRSECAFWEREARGLQGNFDGQTIWRELADGPGFAGHLAVLSAVTDTRLADFWPRIRRRAQDTGTGASKADMPISRYKPATASSFLADPNIAGGRPNPAGAVNGVINGARKFHTQQEQNPWWQVDLGGFATIREIRVYNTTDHTAGRCRNIAVSVSIDGTAWAELAAKRDDEILGTYLTGPFIWSGPGTAWARYVRVTLLGHEFLHLDQVEVYGTLPASAA